MTKKLEKMVLSAYELEREKRIAENQRVLEVLGLAGHDKVSLKPTIAKKKKNPVVRPSLYADAPRRSDRFVGKEQDFAELPDSYHEAEEREALEQEAFEEFRRRSRSTRLKKKPVLFSDVQAASLADDMKRVLERQRENMRQRALKVQTERREELILKQLRANEEMVRRKNMIEQQRKSMQQSIIMQTNSSRQHITTGIPNLNAPTTAPPPPYETITPPVWCANCESWKVPRKDGTPRQHDCFPPSRSRYCFPCNDDKGDTIPLLMLAGIV